MNVLFLFLLICSSLSLHLYATEDQDPPTQPLPQWSYYGELELHYLDQVVNPISQASNSPSSNTTNKAISSNNQTNRTLGLKRARLGLDLSLPSESGLHLLFRPDVLNREGLSQTDPDTRAGNVYFPTSSAKFLDEYFLTLDFKNNAQLDLGVFSSLVHRYQAYKALLDFGLEVRFMEHFSGMRLGWNSTPSLQYNSLTSDQSRWFGELWALQGNDDRAEAQSDNDETRDRAPVSKDAHLGVAGAIGYRINSNVVTGILAASNRTDIEQAKTDPDQESGSNRSKRDELFFQQYLVVLVPRSSFSSKFALDYRLLNEKFKSDTLSTESRTHQSIAITGSNEVMQNFWLVAGTSFGKSKYENGLWVDGYQMDAGMQVIVKSNCTFSLMFAEEHRSQNSAANKQGGFVIDDNFESILRRFAIGVDYRFAAR